MKCNFASTLLLCTLFPSWLQGQEKPNIVYIMADDLGYGDLSCYGAKLISTPNIDKLAAQGRSFTDAHSVSAVSTPSRYGFLTGTYPFRYNDGEGYWGPLSHRHPLLIEQNQGTVASMLKKNGYSTACIGKWHLGFQEELTDWNQPLRPGPIDVGFDYYFGVPFVSSAPPYFYVENDKVVGWEENDPIRYDVKPFTETIKYPEKSGNRYSGGKKAHSLYKEEETAELFVEKSVKWIKENKKSPFFLLLTTTHIHHPFTPGERFKGSSKCGLYGDYVQEFDWMVGEIMAVLKKEGLDENTLFIVTSDNGAMLNVTGQKAYSAGHRMNSVLFGFKFDAWEGGHRIPFIVRWPGNVKPGTSSDQLISNIDMYATFASVVGHKLDDNEALDSYNVLDAFIENPVENIRDYLFIAPHKSSHLALRTGDWVYIPGQGGGGWERSSGHTTGGILGTLFTHDYNSDIYEGKLIENAPKVQLFNLRKDKEEKINLAERNPEKLREIQTLYKEKKSLLRTRK